MTFQKGQKVVPFSKSAGFTRTLDESTEWKKACEIGQPFLYVNSTDFIRGVLLCNARDIPPSSGDYFLPSDLIPFEETNEKCVHVLKKEMK